MCSESLIKRKIDGYVNEYIRFMNIEKFPSFDLKFKMVSKSIADSQGFEVPAYASYQVQTQAHVLCVSTNIELPEYLMFHEFTHILDSEQYVRGDPMRYAGLSGYTEYHASQVELALLMGASSIASIPAFSMNTIISTLGGEKSVSQYVQDKLQHAIELFSRDDFPADISTLKTAIGVLYNYWGLRSICEMYAIDFAETVNNEAFLKYIPTLNFTVLNQLMHGWLNESNINLSIPIYTNIVFPIIQTFKLA